ncbi:TonB-dependent Receptor Plug Domain [Sphingobium sp. AP50]|uniref:TonB-dependent receptor plug domain-containing protein n=1 Tax=Sphingobium sp. AP50 TaxID=1884369 RepID=UPI0008AB3D90|nr:TonB-dependent receptor [Sphingobium sp. AP50]SEK00688.1 TonB-dependent Receptor Plug Domain [Sphingobium sp. AP50]
MFIVNTGQPTTPPGRIKKTAFSFLGASSFALILSSAALAQSSEGTAAAQQADGATDIVVTGSRIARRDFVADSPIVTVSNAALDSNGNVSLEGKLNKLPQLLPGATAYTANIASAGQATLNLRGLGASRNLVLLDGRRMQPAGATMAIDVNNLPAILVENVEIISGGASAVYGSDAMSGVVNFKLRRNFIGLQLDAQSNISGQSDGATQDISVLAGMDFAGGRGHLMVAGEYYNREGLFGRDRKFYTDAFTAGGSSVASNSLPAGTFNPTAGNLPTTAALNTLFASYGTVGASIAANTVLGFNNDSTLFTDTNGVRNYRGVTTGYTQRGASLYYDPNAEVRILAPLHRYAGFARADYELSDSVSAFVQGMATRYAVVTGSSGALAQGNQALVIPVVNPFIPADLAKVLASRPNSTADFNVTKRFTAAGLRNIKTENTVYQILAGLTGKLGDSGISWDLSYSHGNTKTTSTVISGGLSYDRVETLLRATDGGASLCEGGLNVFGEKAISQSCLNYLSVIPSTYTNLSQDSVEANVQGGLFNLPAGELRFAAGGSYRRNAYRFTADAEFQTNPTQIISFNPSTNTRGTTDVVEGYAELLIPVLKDLPLVKSLNLDAAYRYSRYNVSGGVSAYKIDANWHVVEPLRLRGGFQRAVRAPNVGELFLGSSAAIGSFNNLGSVPSGGDPCDVRSGYRSGANGAAVRSLCIAQGVPSSIIDSFQANNTQVLGTTSGFAGLKPESANTYTIGAVLSSPFASPLLRRMSLSVDYYNIAIKDAIGTISGVTLVNSCFNATGTNRSYAQSSPYCSGISRNTDGTIYNINQPYLNLGGYKTAGIDFAFDWRLPLDAKIGGDSGDLTVNVLANYLDNFKIQSLPGGAYIDYAGTIGSGTTYVPWRITSTIGYDSTVFGLGVRWQHLSRLRDYTSISAPAAEKKGVPGYDTFDLFGHVKATDRFQIRFGVTNLADKKPPIVSELAGSTDPSTYDPMGRSFYLGVRATL